MALSLSNIIQEGGLKSANKQTMLSLPKSLSICPRLISPRCGSSLQRCELCLMAASMVLALFFQFACASKKSVTPLYATSPVRVALLPFNIPDGNDDLRWVAIASPIMMAMTSEYARDLEVIPLWESMPIAKEAAGASRIFTQQSAENAAQWLSAKWAIMGELAPAESRISAIIDFIPASSDSVPFRFIKTGRPNRIGSSFDKAFQQFLRYLLARPLEKKRKERPDMTSQRTLAEAIDREYGWFVDEEPGKAQEIVAKLLKSDPHLARFLFNPSIYPILKPSGD
jgi:hypothetical protein